MGFMIRILWSWQPIKLPYMEEYVLYNILSCSLLHGDHVSANSEAANMGAMP